MSSLSPQIHGEDAHASDAIERYKLEALRFVTGLLPASAAVFYSVDGRMNAIDHVVHRVRAEANDPYLAYFHAIDPFHPRHFANTELSLVSMRDVASAAAFERSEYCTGFLAPLGLLYEAQLYLRDAGRIVGGLSFLRRREDGDFTHREFALLRHVHRFVEESYRCFQRTQATPAESSALMHELGLSRRELEVAELVCRGATNAEIARTLFISLPTVKTHMQHILAKARVRSRAELIFVLGGGAPATGSGRRQPVRRLRACPPVGDPALGVGEGALATVKPLHTARTSSGGG